MTPKRADELQAKTFEDVMKLRKGGMTVSQALSQLTLSTGIAQAILAARYHRELRKRAMA